jgi:hypothetical protein
MKTSKQLFVIIALLGASFAFAAETKPAAPAGKKGGCCVKAETAGAACAHLISFKPRPTRRGFFVGERLAALAGARGLRWGGLEPGPYLLCGARVGAAA